MTGTVDGAHPRVVSVHLGEPRQRDWAGRLRRTAIAKHPATAPVRVHRLGLEGDQVADTQNHGGVDQAVYAFAREDLDAWVERLGEPIPDGQFGENLTTAGIDVNQARVGERWRVGTVLLEIASVRIPCSVFKGWMGVSGYDDTAWVKRFTAEARPGPYLRVLEEGALAPGDAIVVEHVPDHPVTVTTMFQALTTRRDLLPELLRVPDLVPEAREEAQRYVAGAAG